jgi:hypothetical protein
MPCLAALIIFSILGIFSASHRRLAKEALDCVFRRVTLRPCDTGFDVRVKAKILGPILPRYPKVARLVAKYFEGIAWVFMVLMTVSTIMTVQGLYNFWAWGDCNGQYATGGFCAFDPTGENSKITGGDGAECKDLGMASTNLSTEGVVTTLFPTSGEGKEVWFAGCYGCEFSRRTYPLIKALTESQPVMMRWGHFVTKEETRHLLAYDACVQQLVPERYANYVDRLYQADLSDLTNEAFALQVVSELGLAPEMVEVCLEDEGTTQLVQQQQNELAKTGLYGTPTVFIDDTAVVGPKPMRVYERLVRGSWF